MCKRFTSAVYKLSLTLFWLFLCVPLGQSMAPGCHLTMRNFMKDYKYSQKGDVIIGGIFTVHSLLTHLITEEDPFFKKMCSVVYNREYQQLQAFILAIDEINRNPDILPNVTLGYHVYDSCGYVVKVMKDILQIMSGDKGTVPNYTCMEQGEVAGFIGDLHSLTTLPMAQLLNFFGYTQISFGARDPLLSDRTLYPNFFRTVQSYQMQHAAIANILRSFGWNWVGIITSADDAGDQEMEHLSKQLYDYGICTEFKMKVNFMSFDFMTLKIKASTTEIVVICGTMNLTLLDFLHHLIFPIIRKTFIFPVSWALATHLYQIEHLSDHSLVVSPPCRHIPALQQHLSSFNSYNHPSVMYIKDIYLQYYSSSLLCFRKRDLFLDLAQHHPFNCIRVPNVSPLSHNFSGDPATYQAYIAVLSMAQALHDVNMAVQRSGKKRRLNTLIFRHKLRHFVSKIDYRGPYNEHLFFNEKGEFPESLDIVNIVLKKMGNKNVPSWTYVGKYDPTSPEGHQLNISHPSITWKHGKVPQARCSLVCPPGSRKALRKSSHTCCYDCVLCSEGEVSNVSDSENCQKCPDDEWPNAGKNACFPRIIEYLSYKTDTVATMFSAISGLFFILTIFIICTFVSFWDTPIVKANNRNMSFILLISLMLSLLCVFLFIGRPEDITCMLRQICFGITFTVAVSSILAKTIIVCIAFKATRPGSPWRKLMGVKLMNSVVLICSSVQVLTGVVWLSVSPPFQEYDRHSYPGIIIIQCNEGSVLAFYFMLGYMGFLAALSFGLAFMVRTLPDIFNEAKYITLSMLVFCIVWVCAIPAYLSSKGKHSDSVEIFAILTSDLGILSFIFFPKCYNILQRPEINRKKHFLEKH